MRRIKLFFVMILSLPKSMLFNLRVFPFMQAIRLPVFVSWKTTIKGAHRGCVVVRYQSTFCIRFGLNSGSEAIDYNMRSKSLILFNKNGKLIFEKNASFARGTVIECYGLIYFGSDFSCNKNCLISCNHRIHIDSDVLLGWDVMLRDSDGHHIGSTKQKDNLIFIGNHVWICAHVQVLKNVNIPEGCVVGYNSCVLGTFSEKNCLLGGYPAKTIKQNINWSR